MYRQIAKFEAKGKRKPGLLRKKVGRIDNEMKERELTTNCR